MTLRTRQLVQWGPAPEGIAQIEELRRTHVRIIYFTRTGRCCRPVVPATAIRPAAGFLFDNIYGRGALPRSKDFPPPPRKARD